MKTKKFIKQLRDEILRTFNEVELITYNYDEHNNTHYFLVPEEIYETKEFAELDYKFNFELRTLEDHGIVCFMTDPDLFTFEGSKIYVNRFQNEILIKHLDKFIEMDLQPEPSSVSLDTSPISSREYENDMVCMSAGENTYAMAA